MKNKKGILLCLCLLATALSLQAQTTDKNYQQKAGNFALGFNGVIEKGYPVGYVNTPYYPEAYTNGSFVFRGVKYTDVKLRTDCREGRLLAQSPDGKFNLTMSPLEIPRAVIGGKTFVYFSAKESAMGEGYYVALYEGKDFAIYKQCYVNNVNKEIQGRIQLLKFLLKERILLHKDGQWSILTGKSSFIKHFKHQKEKLQAYCKEKDLNPGKKNDADWKTLAEYCETLD